MGILRVRFLLVEAIAGQMLFRMNKLKPNNHKDNRVKKIIRASMIGILTNFFLAALKMVLGIISNSIAITLDAVNNISDAASSVITIVGTKLAEKAPDKKHPFGHGRIEYLSAIIISLLIIYAGISSLAESIKKIIHPETPDYSPVMIIVIAVAVAVKIILGRYVISVGVKTNSESLNNSGKDSILDAVITAATLVAAVIFILWDIQIEAWLAAVISIVIIKSGIDMLRNAFSPILGERTDAALTAEIKHTIEEFPEVCGAYDLVLHNYGPECYQGSVHIEVPYTCSANDLDKLIRLITKKVYEKHHITLTAIGIYSVNTNDEDVMKMRKTIEKVVLREPYITEIHAFFYQKEEKTIRFDLVVSFDAPNRYDVFCKAVKKVQKLYPDFRIMAAIDTNYSEE